MSYDILAEKSTVEKTMKALKERSINSLLVNSKEEALAKIKELVPAGASIMNGASITLEQIGFVDYLKSGQHGWNNLHAVVLAENDADKRANLRKHAVVSDYYLGSAHAIAEDGQIVVASNSGSQLPHLVFTSKNIILVVGTQKIAPTLAEALTRLENYVVPLEDKHMKDVGYGGTQISKLLIIKHENLKQGGRNFTVMFVNEKLGF